MTPKRPRVEIKYCTQCRWLLRAAWMAQELLTTFQDDIGELALIPGTGGIFDIRANNRQRWYYLSDVLQLAIKPILSFAGCCSNLRCGIGGSQTGQFL